MRYCYSGSWCAEGTQTSWSGRWRVDGELGSCAWDGDSAPVSSLAGTGDQPDGTHLATGAADPIDQVTPPLNEFVTALRTGARPWGDAHDNLWSFAIAQAAILSARRREHVRVDEVFGSRIGRT